MELGKGGNSEKALLERKGENAFYGRKFNSNFDFILDKNGKVTGIQMTQGKQSIKCKKVA
jgi:D-alanyl-D-alanine carboxypeptidase